MQTTIRTLPSDTFRMKQPLTIRVKRSGRKFTANLAPCGLIMTADGPSVRSVRDKLRRGLILQCEIFEWSAKRKQDPALRKFTRAVKQEVAKFVEKVA